MKCDFPIKQLYFKCVSMWLIQLALIQQLQLLWAYLTELPLSIQLLWNWYWSISIKHKKVLFVIFAGNSLHYLSSICLAAASASYFKVIVMHSTQCRLKYKKRKEKKRKKESTSMVMIDLTSSHCICILSILVHLMSEEKIFAL